MLSRRELLTRGAAAVAYLAMARPADAHHAVPMFRTPLPVPPVLRPVRSDSTADYYEGSVPLPSHQRTTLLPCAGASGRREGDSIAVPTFTTHRLMGVGPSFSPAASLWVRRSSSPQPRNRHKVSISSHHYRYSIAMRTAGQPISAMFELVVLA